LRRVHLAEVCFFAKILKTPVSSYVLLPDGSTKYACELVSSKNPVKELFGFKNNEQVACSLEEAVEIRVNPSSVIEHECKEPTNPDSPYWKILRMKEIYYKLICTEKTEVISKLVKSESKGTHFGKRIDGDYMCLEL
jgi:hypothetical protein